MPHERHFPWSAILFLRKIRAFEIQRHGCEGASIKKKEKSHSFHPSLRKDDEIENSPESNLEKCFSTQLSRRQQLKSWN